MEFRDLNAQYQALKGGIDQVYGLSVKLETALADWQPSVANSLSDELEDALTALEKKASDAAEA